jgi:hypothetical protein
MSRLCSECAHHLYGYPVCGHQFEDGRCIRCGWDQSRSAFITSLIDERESAR